MKFRTLVILTSILLFSFIVFIYFTLNESKGQDALNVFNENNQRFENIAHILLSQDYLYRVAKIGFDQATITIDPRTGKPFTVKINRVAEIHSDIYNGMTFNDFCSEYKLDQDIIKEMVNLLIDEDIFFIKRSFGDSTVWFGINYEERIIFKPQGVTEFEKKRYKLIKDDWYYLKERM